MKNHHFLSRFGNFQKSIIQLCIGVPSKNIIFTTLTALFLTGLGISYKYSILTIVDQNPSSKYNLTENVEIIKDRKSKNATHHIARLLNVSLEQAEETVESETTNLTNDQNPKHQKPEAEFENHPLGCLWNQT